jgi:hypothetical protein
VGDVPSEVEVTTTEYSKIVGKEPFYGTIGHCAFGMGQKDPSLDDVFWVMGKSYEEANVAYSDRMNPKFRMFIEKENPYRDEHGRFTTADQDVGGGVSDEAKELAKVTSTNKLYNIANNRSNYSADTWNAARQELSRRGKTVGDATSEVEVITVKYSKAAGKEPFYGTIGHWAFGMGQKDPSLDDVFWVRGKSYAEAVDAAATEAKKRGVSRVYVQS